MSSHTTEIEGLASPTDNGSAEVPKPEAPKQKDGYAAPESEAALAGYAAMLAVFLGAFGSLAFGARRSKRLPEHISPRDILLLGVATHKLTRIITRERIAAPLRAPFTRYQGSDGAGLVKEEPRGATLRRAVGNMLVCQYCAGPWVAAALTTGLIFAPRTTRLASSLFAMVATSDFLHQAYAGARKWG
jgi:hypothetical protein